MAKTHQKHQGLAQHLTGLPDEPNAIAVAQLSAKALARVRLHGILPHSLSLSFSFLISHSTNSSSSSVVSNFIFKGPPHKHYVNLPTSHCALL